jgi:hypothetical protein
LGSTTPADKTTLGSPASHRLRTLGCLVVLSAICVASRLPQLRSPNLLVDGDESVLGLMAKHVAEGREFPIFFYGQHYALATVEAGAGALSFLIAGVSAVSLKLAMLGLWTIGVLFSFLALSKLLSINRSFWITAVLVVNPMWAAWSMKGGGGYLTSFTATAMLLWLLVHERERETVVQWLIAGALTAVIYLAQPLWLPGVVPTVLVVLFASRRRLSWGAAYVAVTAGLILFVKLATPMSVDTWGGPALGNPNLFGSLSRVAQQVYVYLTGSYYLQWAIDPPGPATKILAVVWCVARCASAVRSAANGRPGSSIRAISMTRPRSAGAGSAPRARPGSRPTSGSKRPGSSSSSATGPARNSIASDSPRACARR